MVDYLQILSCRGARDERARLDEIVRRLKLMSKMAPVLLISQLKRPAEGKIVPPNLFDFRGSGMIEANADLALFPWRPSYLDTGNPDEFSTDAEDAVIYIRKHRMGRAGKFKVTFFPDCTRFADEVIP